jgi:hypothetical protein
MNSDDFIQTKHNRKYKNNWFIGYDCGKGRRVNDLLKAFLYKIYTQMFKIHA